MDAKLEAHRAQKRRQELFNKYKNLLWNMVSFQNTTAIDIDGKKNDDDHKEDDDRDGVCFNLTKCVTIFVFK